MTNEERLKILEDKRDKLLIALRVTNNMNKSKALLDMIVIINDEIFRLEPVDIKDYGITKKDIIKQVAKSNKGDK